MEDDLFPKGDSLRNRLLVLFVLLIILVFVIYSSFTRTKQLLRGVVDSQTVASISTKRFQDEGYYKLLEGSVYFRMSGADAQTFQDLGDFWAKDQYDIFYRGKVIDARFDPASFVVVGGGAIKDDTQVYLYNIYENTGSLLSGVDTATFQYVGVCDSVERSSANYFRDKHTIFVEDSPMKAIDPASFEYFGNYWATEGMPYSVSYAKDKDSVYQSCGEMLEDADPSTFVDLTEGYAKDKDTVWYLAEVIDGVDVASFEFVGRMVKDVYGNAGVYAKDSYSVYSGRRRIKGADPTLCTAESLLNCELH